MALDPAWEEWFEIQHELCRVVDGEFHALTLHKSDELRANVCAAVIEHMAEKLRQFLKLPSIHATTEESG